MSRLGVEALSDRELLAIILATGMPGASVLAVAADVAQLFPGPSLAEASLEELCQLPGVGKAKAARLVAALELGRRSLQPPEERPLVRSAADAYAIIGPELGNHPEERAITLLLDLRGSLISTPTVAMGGLSSLALHPRHVFREAIRRDATCLLLAHNHPTGDIRPSADDIETTRRLLDIGIMLGIPLVDHLVVAVGGFTSIRETTRLWDGGPDQPRAGAASTIPS